MGRPIRGRLWRKSRHGGGQYLAGLLDDGSRIVVWERGTRRVKGDPACDVEVWPPLPAAPTVTWDEQTGAAPGEVATDG